MCSTVEYDCRSTPVAGKRARAKPCLARLAPLHIAIAGRGRRNDDAHVVGNVAMWRRWRRFGPRRCCWEVV
eukprot:9321805-Pyramimonas_sp.AAC.1